MFAGGTTVTIVSVTTTDDGLGNTTEETVTYEWGPCMVAPRSSENADPRAPKVISGVSVYGPPIDVDPADLFLDSDDRLVIDGVTYEVEGHAGTWPWPAGGTAGVEVAAKRAATV